MKFHLQRSPEYAYCEPTQGMLLVDRETFKALYLAKDRDMCKKCAKHFERVAGYDVKDKILDVS